MVTFDLARERLGPYADDWVRAYINVCVADDHPTNVYFSERAWLYTMINAGNVHLGGFSEQMARNRRTRRASEISYANTLSCKRLCCSTLLGQPSFLIEPGPRMAAQLDTTPFISIHACHNLSFKKGASAAVACSDVSQLITASTCRLWCEATFAKKSCSPAIPFHAMSNATCLGA